MFEIIEITGTTLFIFFILYGVYWLDVNNIFISKNDLLDKSNDKPISSEIISKPEENYEEKYLEKYKKFTNDLSLTEEDLKNKKDKYDELIKLFEKTKELALQDMKNQIDELIMTNLINELNEENANIEEFTNLKKQHLELHETQVDKDEIEKESYEYMCELYYNRLKNSFLFENTPIGNIAMCYNNDKKSFEYYSDKMMPYRYLETVARKYVTTFYCKPLYIDMMNELKNAENKLIEESKKIEELQKIKELDKSKDPKVKDVFARLKNYNTEKQQTGYPSRNNNSNNNRTTKPIPNHLKTKIVSIQNKSNENHVLKENANRYTHNGKFVNFSILKKVDKKKIDKNYELSYKDYMQMIKNIKLK